MAAPLGVVLSDLDDTLYDHRGTTRAALARLRDEIPEFAAVSITDLDGAHHALLEEFHRLVLDGRLSIDAARVARFGRLLEQVGGSGAAGRDALVAARYRAAYEVSRRAVPGALAFVQAVRHAGLPLAIVTNNVAEEQRRKLEHCGLAPWVDALVTSEETGYSKPDPRIVHAALARFDVGPAAAVLIGDAWEADVAGARAAGVRAVWFNRLGRPRPDPSVPEVRSLEPAEAVLRALRG
jgi:HAD superfamily hydrolase (TIGR01509 family)